MPDAQAVLNALPEPVLIVRTDGAMTFANKAANTFFEVADGLSLSDVCVDGADDVRSYLRRCSGSREPTIGKLVMRDRSGAQIAYRCHGSLLRQRSDGEPALVMLRLVGPPEERFSALTRQVDDLNSEVHRRRRIQAMLEAALQERELLLRELNHRVKNNLQMLLSMLSSARAGSSHPETRAVLDRACGRVAAIGAAQSIFYRSGVGGVPTAEFLDQVCRTVMQTLGGGHQLVLDVEEAELSSDLAAPVALMLNELMTNSVKHGFKAGQSGRI
ncbi:MAG TPA: histidine kinase dimerization/phosphoacceptor domain -containing protein, partial [Afifellaceae bacterium]|nr:histidine kinase dimerization/phosphoacceptor domain -containing protein [Afifellaceae bacterium]